MGEKKAAQTGIEKEYDENGLLVYARHFTFEHWYDKNGNVIHHRDKDGERWHEYDEHGNMVHSIYHLKFEGDIEVWHEYDAVGREVHRKDNSGYEQWCDYDADGNIVHFKDSNGVEGRYARDENKLRFKEGVDKEWQEYDERGNDCA